MSRTATVRSLPGAFAVIKEMQGEDYEWGDGYRQAGRQALGEILGAQMALRVDRQLAEVTGRGAADRRNRCYRRWLLSELGRIELSLPRTRRFNPVSLAQAYSRRAARIDRMILVCFELGLLTRKVAKALLPVLGTPVSPATVSGVARILGSAVAAFLARPLANRYPALVLDGVVLARNTGAGVQTPRARRLGPEGRRQEGDHRLPPGLRRERGPVGELPHRSL